ncbi:hypothetical protein [Rhodococcus opacus]|uniref:Uncharacterized protein n=1 Tax=Rhodococcus opacus (strain B4) TaxID=632772 RepID=C1B9A9_RHOOB|nr:hypothetical protein [Rhodococcus opacus]BAH52262.1 hypothetical protein ROP_40150 [Rhodococcus opacus B4]
MSITPPLQNLDDKYSADALDSAAGLLADFGLSRTAQELLRTWAKDRRDREAKRQHAVDRVAKFLSDTDVQGPAYPDRTGIAQALLAILEDEGWKQS